VASAPSPRHFRSQRQDVPLNAISDAGAFLLQNQRKRFIIRALPNQRTIWLVVDVSDELFAPVIPQTAGASFIHISLG
jgi:hypothetical protein